jgi:hypothetical protein
VAISPAGLIDETGAAPPRLEFPFSRKAAPVVERPSKPMPRVGRPPAFYAAGRTQ